MKAATRGRAPGSFVAALPVIAATIAMGYFAARGGSQVLQAFILVAIGIAVVARAHRTLLAVTLATLILGSVPNAELKQATFYLRFELLGALAIANLLGGGRVFADRQLRGVSLTLGLLGAWAMISVLWSVDPSLTAQRALGLALLVAAVLTRGGLWWNNREAVRDDVAILAGVLGAAMTASLVTLLAGVEWAYLGERFRGIFENPNTLGLSGGLLLPLATGLALTPRGRLERRIWIGVAVITGLLLVLTQSRNGILGGVVGLLILLLGRRDAHADRLKVGILVATLTVILAVTFFPIYVEPVQSTLQSYVQRGSAGRLSAWHLAWDLTRERPLTGWGFGTTEQVFGPRAASIRSVYRTVLVNNGYLQLLLELGPVALVLALAALSGAAWAGFRGSRDSLSWAVFAAFCGGTLMQGAESGMAAAGSIFALNFWFLAVATVRLCSDHGAVPAAGARRAARTPDWTG